MGRHQLKLWLRRVYARLLFHTGLHAVVNRLMGPRLTILFGHCVSDEEVNGFLPAEMKIDGTRLESILSWFARRYSMVTIGEGVEQLATGAGGRLMALSMDDGYKDNRDCLLPILQRTGARATVFLETGPLESGQINWSHKFFWLLSRGESVEGLAQGYRRRSLDVAVCERLGEILSGPESERVYQVKRALKYDAEREDRGRVIDELFAAGGGDEQGLCRALYLTWDDARALRDAGVELGGHTVGHPILSRLDPPQQRAEVRDCAVAIERELRISPQVFAYPFGRRWDYDERSVEAARKAGFTAAVNTHAGTNHAGGFELARLPIDDGAELHLLVAEACGGFELLRRIGLDLSI